MIVLKCLSFYICDLPNAISILKLYFQALAGLVEMPAIAIAIFIIGRVGQKWLFCATFFCAGIACLCAAFVEGLPDMLWLKITFVMIGEWWRQAVPSSAGD